MDLPQRSREAEDAFVSSLEGQDELLVDAVRAAVREGRPLLAARLVQLIEDPGEHDPEISRALRAARFIVHQDSPDLAELDLALEHLRSSMMGRAGLRARRRLKGKLNTEPWKRTRERRGLRAPGGLAPEDAPTVEEEAGEAPTGYLGRPGRGRLAQIWTGLVSLVPAPLRRLVARALAPVERWFSGLTHTEAVHVGILALLIIGSVAHGLVFSIYYIEDAGISVAYARNFIEGEGWVTFAGGERVEGFSNPLWTWLIAAWMALGVNGWTSVKIMGGVFGAITLPLTYLVTRECRPGKDDHLNLLPPLFLAAHTVVAVWNYSGLENSLFSVLLVGGAWRVLVESRQNRSMAFPWSAALFLMLAMTRPEGIVYAAVAGFFRLVAAVRDRNFVTPILAWLAVFFGPFLVYSAWRYSYFAWEFPNTYYAKLDGENRFQPWRWTSRGWKYTNNYLRAYGLAYAAPLFAIALVRLKDWRKWLVVTATVLGAVLLLWDGRKGLPADFDPDWLNYLQRHWDKVRISFLLSCAGIFSITTTRWMLSQRLGVALIGLGVLLLGLFGLEAGETARMAVMATGGGVLLLGIFWNSHEDAHARMLVMALGSAAVFFVIYSGGDWMAQWRFFSYASVPLFILLGLGLAGLIEALPGSWSPRWRAAWLTPIVIALLVPNIWQSTHAAPAPETSVSDVYKRVQYMQWVARRLHIDERITLFDVDMGAHMFYTDWRIVDVAGLVDVPMARHVYQKAFIEEWVLEENAPHFAHQHGGWASKTKIKNQTIWKQGYFEIPGYPTGRRAIHVGNFIRKDLFVRDEYEGPGARRSKLEGDLWFEGWEVPSPQVPVEGKLFVEYWLRAGYREDGVRAYVILDDGQGHRQLAALPVAYDWYAVDEWKSNEHVRNRYDFDLSPDLPEGTYDLGFLFIDTETGQVLAPLEADPAEPRVAQGALWFDGVVELVDRDAAHSLAEDVHGRALEQLSAGDCQAGLESWRKARYHVWKDQGWAKDRQEGVSAAAALCFVQQAARAETEAERIALLREAREHDHRQGAVIEACEPLAAELDARGDAAAAQEDWEAAYAAWRDALWLDPTLSWTRRKAEDARDRRLGIEGKTRDGRTTTKTSLGKKDRDDEGDEAEDEEDPRGD